MISVKIVDRDVLRKKRDYFLSRFEGVYLRNHLGHTAADTIDIAIDGFGDVACAYGNEGGEEVDLCFSVELTDGTAFITVIEGTGFKHAAPVLDAWLVDYAKSNNCKRIALCGRIGWIYALRDYGYKGQLVIMAKEI